MRQKLLIILLCCVGIAGKAQYVSIPDTNFRAALKQYYPSCFNAQDQMDTTCSAIVNEYNIVYLGSYGNLVKNLDGIQYFKNLTSLSWTNGMLEVIPKLPPMIGTLNLWNNKLTSLPALPPNLNVLNVEYNKLTSLPALPTAFLRELKCNDNLLTTLPSLPATLQVLDCRSNKLTSLPALGSNLNTLHCSGNNIVSLPALPVGLDLLNCGSNKLTSLPSLPQGLTKLWCWDNELTTLPTLPSTLNSLNCYRNRITSLPPLPPSLKDLDISHNKVALSFFSSTLLPSGLLNLNCSNDSLNTLPSLPASLTDLRCSNNFLQVFPTLSDSLTWLELSGNPLSQINKLPKYLRRLNVFQTNVNCLPVLPITLVNLNIDSIKIKCLPNTASGLIIKHGYDYYSPVVKAIQLCNASNNINNCNAFPKVRGRVFYDFNNNGLKDANELYCKNIKVNLSNGSYTYTNDTGYYEISADTLGNFQMTIAAPNFFTASPNNLSFQFSTYDTSVVKNIALQRTTIKDSLSISIIPMWWRARPGFNYPYRIEYRNAGSTDIASAQITFQYDNTRLNFDSVSNASATHNGNTITLNLSNLLYGSSGYFNTYFKVKTTAPLGDTLRANATITSGAITGVDNHSTVISGAYDPNDKDATPVLTTSQVSEGAYINYTIRFQNTGTDTAFNVVVTDTLSSLLQANTLELLSTSHPCKTIAEDDKIAFEFRDILLPDSNVNEPASHGFIRFRIKPKPTVVVGNTISNKAAIYFDYNSPVITNTATTQIQNPQVLGLKLISFTANLRNNDIVFNWITRNEINTASFTIEQSHNGRSFISIGRVASAGYGSNNYSFNTPSPNADVVYFRLKMIDKDGSYTYSPVVTVHLQKGKVLLTVSSNPVQTKAVVTYSYGSRNNAVRSIELVDAVGRRLNTYTVAESGMFELNMQDKESGVYVLVMKENGIMIQTVKVVRQ